MNYNAPPSSPATFQDRSRAWNRPCRKGPKRGTRTVEPAGAPTPGGRGRGGRRRGPQQHASAPLKAHLRRRRAISDIQAAPWTDGDGLEGFCAVIIRPHNARIHGLNYKTKVNDRGYGVFHGDSAQSRLTPRPSSVSAATSASGSIAHI